MYLTCYLVDDESHALEVLEEYIRRTPGLELKGSSTNPLEALGQVTSADPPQLTFLDVDMPELSGMAFAGMASLYTQIVFTTSYPEYAIEAFEKDALDYLLKPISYERFLKSVIKVRKYYLEKQGLKKLSEPYFFVKTDIKGKMVRIVAAEINFVEAAQNYVTIHMISGKHMAYLTMEEIEQHLPADRFTRIHRSFIINTGRIRAVEQGQVIMEDNNSLALGRSYKDHFLKMMKDLLLQSKRKAD